MQRSDSGRVPWRVILIQLLVLAGLGIFYKLYLPLRARGLVKSEAATREQKINALFRGSVEDDGAHEISVPLEGAIVKRHPRKLSTVFSPTEARSKLGLPNLAATDFSGGQHLTWTGTDHKLEASFNAGRLYCLTLEDRKTGHGEMVFESPWSWHPY